MISIIDYNAGNLTSVQRALQYLGIDNVITPDPKVVANARRIIFPGVGHAKTAMDVLTQRGLDDALRQAFSRGTPILGICLGSQIILSRSEEGDTPCLGLIEGTSPKFRLADPSLKIPHMGWNAVQIVRPHPLLHGCVSGDEFYFVHSYYPQPVSAEQVYATAQHEIVFPAAVGARNLFAVQFHPEKSGPAGLRILKNFSQWDGAPC